MVSNDCLLCSFCLGKKTPSQTSVEVHDDQGSPSVHLSDQEPSTSGTKPTKKAPKRKTSAAAAASKVPKKQRLNLEPTTSTPGGFDVFKAGMEGWMATMYQSFKDSVPPPLPPTPSTTVKASKKKKVDKVVPIVKPVVSSSEEESSSTEDSDQSSDDQDNALHILPEEESDFGMAEENSSAKFQPESTVDLHGSAEEVPATFKTLVHFVNSFNKFETSVSQPSVTFTRSCPAKTAVQQVDYLPASQALAGYMDILRQDLLSSGRLDFEKVFPKPPRSSPKFKEHGPDVMPNFAVVNADFILCLKGLDYDEVKNRRNIKDSILIPGPVSRTMEIANVDTFRITNYLDIFNVTIMNIAIQVQDQLKDLFPQPSLDDSNDVITISHKQLDTLYTSVLPLMDKTQLISEAAGDMLDRVFRFLAYDMSIHQLARRDAALLSLSKKVPQDIRNDLRMSPLGKQVLFDPDVVSRAKEWRDKHPERSQV